MLIFNKLDDINAVYGILYKVANEVNDYYWHTDSVVDPERAAALDDLRFYLIDHGYIDKGYDLAELSFSFLHLYPASSVNQENDRQYHAVLNKLSDVEKSQFLWDIRKMEQETGDTIAKSVKFDMALKLVLNDEEEA